jgi:hypothetical protein
VSVSGSCLKHGAEHAIGVHSDLPGDGVHINHQVMDGRLSQLVRDRLSVCCGTRSITTSGSRATSSCGTPASAGDAPAGALHIIEQAQAEDEAAARAEVVDHATSGALLALYKATCGLSGDEKEIRRFSKNC